MELATCRIGLDMESATWRIGQCMESAKRWVAMALAKRGIAIEKASKWRTDKVVKVEVKKWPRLSPLALLGRGRS